MFYFSSDDIELAGASPETLVKLEDKNLPLSHWQEPDREARQSRKTGNWKRDF